MVFQWVNVSRVSLAPRGRGGGVLACMEDILPLIDQAKKITSTKILERPSDSTMPAPLIDLGPVPLELPPQKERTSPARSLLQVESETMPNLKITVNLDMCEDKLQRLSSTIPL